MADERDPLAAAARAAVPPRFGEEFQRAARQISETYRAATAPARAYAAANEKLTRRISEAAHMPPVNVRLTAREPLVSGKELVEGEIEMYAAAIERALRRTADAQLEREPGGQPPRGSASFERKAFNAAVRLLRAGEIPAEVARQTGIHRNRVARIRDRYVFPRAGGPEYEAVRGQDRDTVVLRRRI